jgi:thiamine pyrophosphokinase
MRVLICTYPTPKIREVVDLFEDDFIIGVDQALKYLNEQEIKVDLAVGDFDSLENKEILTRLKVVKLSNVKDVTDTHQALLEAMKLNPSSIEIIGGIGGRRIEHFIAITLLFDVYPNLKIKNENSTLFVLNKGMHNIHYEGYISIFGFTKAILSLRGFQYELLNYELNFFDPLGISNELKHNQGMIEVKEGSVLIILSKKETL